MATTRAMMMSTPRTRARVPALLGGATRPMNFSPRS